jgi:hypothetical protein
MLIGQEGLCTAFNGWPDYIFMPHIATFQPFWCLPFIGLFRLRIYAAFRVALVDGYDHLNQ